MTKWLEFDSYAVFGLGISGIAVANVLARRGKRVLASDTRLRDAFGTTLEALDERVQVIYGKNAPGNAEVVVVSPGLPPYLSIFEDLKSRNIPVISEVELAFVLARAPFIALTGTDGKTTTTQLTGEIMKASGRDTIVAGNIGIPLCGVVEDLAEQGVIVAEISASQLWSCASFRPHVAAFTNIAPDHLDYFESYQDYIDAKHSLLKNMDGNHWGVFNYEDEVLRDWAKHFGGRRVGYGLHEHLLNDCEIALWSDGEQIFIRHGTARPQLLAESRADLPLKGRHNLLNMMCAAAIALTQGVELETIHNVLTNFQPLAHRIEPCGELNGVSFINDSKATNVHAAIAGLRSVSGEFVAIVGGVDKGLEIDELIDYLVQNARTVVLIGQISDRMEKALLTSGYGQQCIQHATSMQEAVDKAYANARAGSTVILSPACSSFDMFTSYAQRGEQFKAAYEMINLRQE